MISTPATLPDYPHTSTTDCGEILSAGKEFCGPGKSIGFRTARNRDPAIKKKASGGLK